MYSAATPTYISQVAPPEIRGMMLAPFSFVMLIGQWVCQISGQCQANLSRFVLACILQGTQHLSGNLSFLVPIITQYIVPGILFTCTWFLPESPSWLVGRGKTEAARASLGWLYGATCDVDKRLLDLQDTPNKEKACPRMRYFACFKCSNLVCHARPHLFEAIHLIGVKEAHDNIGWNFILTPTRWRAVHS
jgi:hypothetical protein